MNISTMFLLLRNSSDCCLFAFASLPHMSIRAGVVVAVALHEVDNAPDTKPGSQSYNKGLQNAYCRIKKCHKVLLSCRVCGCPKKGIKNGGQFW